MSVNQKSGMTALEQTLCESAENIRTNEKDLNVTVEAFQQQVAITRARIKAMKDSHVALCRSFHLPPPEDFIEHEEPTGSIQ